MEVKISIMQIFQSCFFFLLLNAKMGGRRLICFLFIVPPFYFLPFQVFPILAKLQSGKIPLLPSSLSFCFGNFTERFCFFPKEWGKENVKENIPKKISKLY